MQTCTQTRTHSHSRIRMYKHAHTCTQIRVHSHSRTHMHTDMHADTQAHVLARTGTYSCTPTPVHVGLGCTARQPTHQARGRELGQKPGRSSVGGGRAAAAAGSESRGPAVLQLAGVGPRFPRSRGMGREPDWFSVSKAGPRSPLSPSPAVQGGKGLSCALPRQAGPLCLQGCSSSQAP